ncbi:MAG: precorrin-6y C5,15-methyltransferase (decarboxylating) subunit CbiE [Desulfuromonas thiophila]|nr:precorrin-6y C5,15-methyltransferase (decarboxylating) subunit CbiE [Desulfuromonas thiophila]
MTPPIIIAGCGPGHADYLTTAVRNAVADTDVLVGARHLLELFPEVKATRLTVGADIPAVLTAMEQHRDQRMVVLVSGDSGLFSLARRVQQHFGREQCRLIPGISSVQVACARLGIDWNDLRIVSAHGRAPEATVDELRHWRKIAILAGTHAASEWAADLLEALGAEYRAMVCENLTLAEEKIHPCDAATLRQASLASHTIIMLQHQEVTT